MTWVEGFGIINFLESIILRNKGNNLKIESQKNNRNGLLHQKDAHNPKTSNASAIMGLKQLFTFRSLRTDDVIKPD